MNIQQKEDSTVVKYMYITFQHLTFIITCYAFGTLLIYE